MNTNLVALRLCEISWLNVLRLCEISWLNVLHVLSDTEMGLRVFLDIISSSELDVFIIFREVSCCHIFVGAWYLHWSFPVKLTYWRRDKMAAIFQTTQIVLNENMWISIGISLKFLPEGLINNIPALVQIIAWCRPGDKPLPEPVMVSYWRIYASLSMG